MWLNGYNSDQFESLRIENAGGGTYDLRGDLTSAYGSGFRTINNYASVALAVAAVESFVEEAGVPWLIIGDLSTIVAGQMAAVNFATVLQFNDGGTGIYMGVDITNGYQPWGNYSDARAGILELLGNKQV